MKANINDTPLKILSIPNAYTRPNGDTIHGYNQLIEFHYTDGFREIVIPTFDPATYRQGGLIIDGDDITFEVIEKTAQELENEIENEAHETTQGHIGAGIEASNRLKTYLKRNLNNNQYKNARGIVRPVWVSLRHGDWDIALEEMQAIQVNNEPYITMKAVIIGKIQEYLDNNNI